MVDALNAMDDPTAMAEAAKMMKDPNFIAQVQKMAKDPAFQTYFSAVSLFVFELYIYLSINLSTESNSKVIFFSKMNKLKLFRWETL